MYDTARDWSEYAPQTFKTPVPYYLQGTLFVFFLSITLFLLSATISNNKNNLSFVNILQFLTTGGLASLSFGLSIVFLADFVGIYV